MTCTASAIVDTSGLRERAKPAADHGAMLHGVAERCLREGTEPVAGDKVSPADAASVRAYVDHVREKPGSKLYEVKADLIPGLLGGTADCVRVDPPILEVIDYKSGSIFVDPVGNWQLTIYAAAVARKLAAVVDPDEVVLTIVQPALDSFNSWTLSRKALERRARQVEATVERVVSGEVEFAPSEEACRFCSARPICPAHHEMTRRAARDDFAGLGAPEVPEEASVPSWGERLRLVPYLREWCKAVEAEARARLLEGEEVDGFKTVEGRRGNRTWGDPKAARRLLESWGLDETELYTEPVMISPAQAEKAVKARTPDRGEFAARKKELDGTIQEGAPGAPTVVPEEDSRPALDRGGMARRDFEGAE